MTGPERIWARRECRGFGGGWMGTWRETLHEPEADRTGYVRVDLHDEVVKALRDCVDDLEAHMKAEYGHPNVHPAMQAKFDRDMEPVRGARAALSRMEGG